MDASGAEGGTGPIRVGSWSGIDGSEWASMPTRGRGGELVIATSSSNCVADIETCGIAYSVRRTIAVSIIWSPPLTAPGIVATP